MQGAFANSELPTGEMTVMAGLTAEDEPKLMPFGFAVHDESFFRVPEWHGLQVRRSSRAYAIMYLPRRAVKAWLVEQNEPELLCFDVDAHEERLSHMPKWHADRS